MVVFEWSIYVCFIKNINILIPCNKYRGAPRLSSWASPSLYLHIYVQTPVHLIEQGLTQLSDIAKIVASLATSNGLALNIKKTHAILFGSKSTIKQFKEVDITKITINSSCDYIPFIDQITSLGIELDSTLS